MPKKLLRHTISIRRGAASPSDTLRIFDVEIVILTAFGVGGATVLGAALGLIFRHTSRRFNDGAMSFAAGVMLAASMTGLILPSLEYGGELGFITTIIGIFVGAASVNLMDVLLLRLFRGREKFLAVKADNRLRQVFLFVMAIAIHNLPEGIAAGVGFGKGSAADGVFIATAIALQNIPEGMAVIVAMLDVGIKRWRTFYYAALTGVVEIFGTFIGYFAVYMSEMILPFALAFAGGNMLYVIAEEMIPETHSEESGGATYFMLMGFCLMLLIGALL